MKEIASFEKVVKYKTEILEVSDDLILILDRKNSKISSYTIIEKKYFKLTSKKNNNYKIKKNEKLGDFGRWEYYSPEIFNEIKTKYFTEINYHAFEINPYKELKEHGKLDKKRILYFDRSGHIIYRMGQEAPVSSIFLFDYIGGVNNYDFNIKEALAYLKKKKLVLQVEVEEIPYYNAEPNRTKGLKMEVLLPQSTINKLWEKVKKDPYPSVRLREFIIPKRWHSEKDPDPLGLKKFMRSKKEIELLEQYNKDRYYDL